MKSRPHRHENQGGLKRLESPAPCRQIGILPRGIGPRKRTAINRRFRTAYSPSGGRTALGAGDGRPETVVS